MRKLFFSRKLICILSLSLLALPLCADTIKTKDGQTYDGKITYEGDDIVKIELQITASIKETKIISRNDILVITKQAADDVAFGKFSTVVPTKPLMSASQYRTALETGPEAFLKSFPDSKHKTKVEEIRKVLKEELDQVERGNIQIGGKWYSPQEQIDFKTLVGSKVSLYRMENYVKASNYNGFIGALREFEVLEENHFGTPAYAEGLSQAQQIVPGLGRMLTRMLQDVEYRNAEWEKNKEQMKENERKVVEDARKQEEEQFKTDLAADRKAGIKWVRLNPRSKSSIEGYLNMLKAEMPKLQSYDVEKLKAQAEEYEKVDHLIAEGRLDLAQRKLSEASAMDVTAASKDSSSKKKRTSSKRKKGSKNYLGALQTKLGAKIQERTLAAKALEAAKASEELAADLKVTGKSMLEGGGKKEEGEAKEGDSPTAETASAEEKKGGSGGLGAFAALSQNEEKSKDKKSSKKSSKKSDDEDDEDEEEEREKRRARAEASSGGGFNFQYLIWGLTGLIVIAVVVMKVLGIGGKDDE